MQGSGGSPAAAEGAGEGEKDPILKQVDVEGSGGGEQANGEKENASGGDHRGGEGVDGGHGGRRAGRSNGGGAQSASQLRARAKQLAAASNLREVLEVDMSKSCPPKPTGPAPSRSANARRGGGWLGGALDRFGGPVLVLKVVMWVLIAILAFAWTYRAHKDHKHVIRKKYRLADRLTWAATYLSSSCDSDGRFRYAARANGQPHPDPNRYSVLHHGLVLHALTEYTSYVKAGYLKLGRSKMASKEGQEGADVSEAILKAVGYLLRRIDAAPDGDGEVALEEGKALAVWDHRAEGESVASVASTAMVLVALIRADWALDGAVDLRVLRKLGAFLVGMQRQDGLFYESLVVGGRSRIVQAHPLTGEIIPGMYDSPPRAIERERKKGRRDGLSKHQGLPSYALLLLAERDADWEQGGLPELSWMKPAMRGLMGDAEEMDRFQASDFNWKPSKDQHWTLIAASELLSPASPILNVSHLPEWRQAAFTDHWGSRVWTVKDIRDTISSHCLRLLGPVLQEYELLPSYSHHIRGGEMYGALNMHGESFVTAQRVRALSAVLDFLPRSQEEVPEDATGREREEVRDRFHFRLRIESIIRKAGGYLEQMQVSHPSNPYRGGFTRALYQNKVRFTDEAKYHNEYLNEVRMDYVADALLALMPYRQLLLAEAATAGMLYEDGRLAPP